MTDNPEILVSTMWLAARLYNDNIRILDASWHMPAVDRDAKAEYTMRHIPGAQFFDIDAVSASSELPHMAPSPDFFAEQVGAMGIGNGHQIVIYDHAATHSAARAWWTFRLMGVNQVAVLDGGLGKWLAEERIVTEDTSVFGPARLKTCYNARLLSSQGEVARASEQDTAEIIDVRALPRFRGDVPEPRSGLRSGHMPGAKNFPFDQLYHEDGTMKPTEALLRRFNEAGIDLSRPIITSCGSGISAASLSLALERAGHRNHALYDGSWAEWGADPDHKVVTGDA